MFVSVIIAAAGSSTRMGSDVSKQLIKISGKTVLEYSIEAFSAVDEVNEIIISTKLEEKELVESLTKKYKKVKKVTVGGKIRQESVKNAIGFLSPESDIVAIHDAARPLISKEDIKGIIEATVEHGAVCPVSRVADTVKEVEDGIIKRTLDRDRLFLASTPQTFKTDLYRMSLSKIEDGQIFTDDCAIAENAGFKVFTYIMKNDNLKITTTKDLDTVMKKLPAINVRTGHGYDVHKLVPDRALILGGVNIPHTTGLLGHSDADVLVHAIMDALLGAAAKGDIGKLFPDTAKEFEGISSIELLKRVKSVLEGDGYSVGNIDATIVAQAPKLSPFIPEMVKNISETLEIDVSQINVKATTEEHLGFTGEKLGISAHAVAIIVK